VTISRALRHLAGALLIAPIRFYRYFVSPLLPPACRFRPTCSQYAIEAIETHGPLKGAWLALRRLVRCHPIRWLGGASGYDPVPPR
jgi:putative membrane protein insertion efficiency factor